MTAAEVLARLREHEAELRAQGVVRAALFGSLARGEARPDSDIDVMVELDPEARIGVWELSGIYLFIKDLFPGEVDVSHRRAMREYVRSSAERDAVYAF